MHRTQKIIIIGGNAAGPSAAAKAKRINPNAEVILFEAGQFISTGTCELPYLLSGEINDYNKIIFFNPDSFLKEKGVKVFINHFVKKIDPKQKKIFVLNNVTNTLSEFGFDKLILTTGSKPIELNELPFSLENVFPYKSIQNYLEVKKYISSKEVRNILVIGSGYIGLEVADALKRAGYMVSILEREQLPMPSGDDEVQLIIKDLLTKNNIGFLSGDTQTKFIIKNNKFSQLKYLGRYLDFDLVIVAAGIKPNNNIAESIGLKLGNYGGLIVDNRLKTSNPNIFAAGDNIELRNYITLRNDYFPLATHAHISGHIAGENAAGGIIISRPIILNSAFHLCDKFIAHVGLTYEQAINYSINTQFVTAVANNKVKVMPDSHKVFGKIIYDRFSKLILGASFIGSKEVSGYSDLITTMIYNKIPVTNLTEINFNYTPPLSPFINLLSVLGRKIKEKI